MCPVPRRSFTSQMVYLCEIVLSWAICATHVDIVLVCRQAALDVIKATAERLQDSNCVRAQVHRVQHTLDGSAEGRVKNGSERGALVVALTALSAAPGKDTDLAEKTAGFLADLYKWVVLRPCAFACTVGVVRPHAALTDTWYSSV